MLGAGYKVNVIPTEATAHIDGRFLPGYEDEFFDTLSELIGEGIDVEYLSNQPPWETPYDGNLVDAMHRSLLAEDPGDVQSMNLLAVIALARGDGAAGLGWLRQALERDPFNAESRSLLERIEKR